MASDPGSRAPRLAESTRVEAFSDGVFAIALTLLVLDLRSPASEGGFAHSLLSQWPAYLAYLAAFLNIAAIWINHHELFTLVRQVDAQVICANLLLLLVASLFPWPAAVISSAVRDGNHDDQIAATVLYATVGFLVPLAWIVLYRYLSRAPHLLTDPAAAGYARLGVRRSLTSVIVYPAAAALAFADPLAALVAFAALPLFFIATVVRPLRRDDRPGPPADDQ
jgi:uncharacterized membrane protein